MVAAHWLADGFDSEELRRLAGLGRADLVEARRSLPDALASLGYPVIERDSPTDDLPWRGYWDQILWAVREVDHKLSPYAAGQVVLEVLGDVPDLWAPGGGDDLHDLLTTWATKPEDRDTVDEQIRAHLAGLSAGQVPPLTSR